MYVTQGLERRTPLVMIKLIYPGYRLFKPLAGQNSLQFSYEFSQRIVSFVRNMTFTDIYIGYESNSVYSRLQSCLLAVHRNLNKQLTIYYCYT